MVLRASGTSSLSTARMWWGSSRCGTSCAAGRPKAPPPSSPPAPASDKRARLSGRTIQATVHSPTGRYPGTGPRRHSGPRLAQPPRDRFEGSGSVALHDLVGHWIRRERCNPTNAIPLTTARVIAENAARHWGTALGPPFAMAACRLSSGATAPTWPARRASTRYTGTFPLRKSARSTDSVMVMLKSTARSLRRTRRAEAIGHKPARPDAVRHRMPRA